MSEDNNDKNVEEEITIEQIESLGILPKTSKKLYEKIWDYYFNWKKEENRLEDTEDNLIAFFKAQYWCVTTKISRLLIIKRVLLDRKGVKLVIPKLNIILSNEFKDYKPFKAGAFTKEQFLEILNWAEENSQILAYKVLVILGITGGLRIGELWGLNWTKQKIKKTSKGYKINIDYSKTDQGGKGFKFYVVSKRCIEIIDRYISSVPEYIKEKKRKKFFCAL